MRDHSIDREKNGNYRFSRRGWPLFRTPEGTQKSSVGKGLEQVGAD